MTEETGRPQDQGRRHRRKGAPSAETSALLQRYQDSMRRELGDTLTELEPKAAPPGLMLDGVAPPPIRPNLTDRMRLWDLAIKLGRELGAEIDPSGGTPPEAEPTKPRARKSVDFGGA